MYKLSICAYTLKSVLCFTSCDLGMILNSVLCKYTHFHEFVKKISLLLVHNRNHVQGAA